MDRDIKNFEPVEALNGGLDGLSQIKKVINNSSELIKKNGKLILEIAFNQKAEVKMLLKRKIIIKISIQILLCLISNS